MVDGYNKEVEEEPILVISPPYTDVFTPGI